MPITSAPPMSVEDVNMLNGAQRAAILVMYLERPVAKTLLDQFSTKELQQLGMTMAGIDTVAPEVIGKVVGDFVTDLYKAVMVPTTGRDYAMKVLPDLIDGSRKEHVLSTLRRHVSTEFVDFIKSRPARTVATMLQDEHPQTQAIALLLMGPESAAEVMSNMDEQVQLDLALRMPAIERIPSELADDVENCLREALTDHGTGLWAIEAIDETAQILGRLGRPIQEPLLGQIEAHDTELSELLRSRMIRFDDLIVLDGKNAQMLLKNIDRAILMPALRGATAPLRELFLSAMSSRAAQDLREEIELMGKIPRFEVETAQNEIIQTALQLREDGGLQFNVGAGEEMV